MLKQRIRKLVTTILMKTCSSLVKMISDEVINFMQNKCNKWMKYRNILPNHKNAHMGSSIVHLHEWCRADRYANSKLIIKTYLHIYNSILITKTKDYKNI